MAAHVRVVRSTDIARCTRSSLLPSHYRDDGSCRCQPTYDELLGLAKDLQKMVTAQQRECRKLARQLRELIEHMSRPRRG